jgi:hypothetical protein
MPPPFKHDAGNSNPCNHIESPQSLHYGYHHNSQHQFHLLWYWFIHSIINGSTHFRNLFYTDGRTPWTRDQSVERPLPTHRTTQTQNKRTQTFMAWVQLEPTIPAFERGKTVHNHSIQNPSIVIILTRDNIYWKVFNKHKIMLWTYKIKHTLNIFLSLCLLLVEV